MNSTKTLQWSPLQLIVDSTAAIGGVHCSVQWNPRQCFVESTARSESLRYLIVESNALQRNSLQKNRQKSGIDCNVIAFVSGLRCTLSKTAVQRNPLQIFKIPTFGTVMFGFYQKSKDTLIKTNFANCRNVPQKLKKLRIVMNKL